MGSREDVERSFFQPKKKSTGNTFECGGTMTRRIPANMASGAKLNRGREKSEGTVDSNIQSIQEREQAAGNRGFGSIQWSNTRPGWRSCL